MLDKLKIDLAESGWVPDFMIRWGIRTMLQKRIGQLNEGQPQATADFIASLRERPIAAHTDDANSQHYVWPPKFFEAVLGERLKYSSALYEENETSPPTLSDAEEAMLRVTCERAEIKDGMQVLELGCGWGSVSLYIAEHFPNCQITSVSNSAPQKQFIDKRAAERGLKNVEVITCDMNDFSIDKKFDRVVSVEMFEHMQNWMELLRRVSTWLRPDGRVFLHFFTHAKYPYEFETKDDDDWMGRNFFAGGIMPSVDFLDHFKEFLEVEKSWDVNGKHYAQTSEHWLERQDAAKEKLMPVYEEVIKNSSIKRIDEKPATAELLHQRWRMFFLACAEFFKLNDGKEWFVAHRLLKLR